MICNIMKMQCNYFSVFIAHNRLHPTFSLLVLCMDKFYRNISDISTCTFFCPGCRLGHKAGIRSDGELGYNGQ